jgi:hypothetical protein
VAEILNAVPGFSVEQCFHPSIIAASIETPIAVEQGWTIEEDGTIKDAEGTVQYTPPQPEAPVAEPVADAAPEEPTDGA